MSGTQNAPGEQRSLDLARVIEGLHGQVRALADAGAERVPGLEQATRHFYETVAGMAHRQDLARGDANQPDEPQAMEPSIQVGSRG